VKAFAAALIALALVGCNGGTVDRHALTNDAATIDSINCEAWLLSRAVAEGRSTSTFTREQAATLRVQASNFADALGTRPAVAGLERRVRAKAVDAAKLAERLRLLHAHPEDRSRARQLAERFRQTGNCR
jgi:2-oxo-4-hydroxy-4-carboxy--5-ureidoimidazoline (OHCU) decarboxylase